MHMNLLSKNSQANLKLYNFELPKTSFSILDVYFSIYKALLYRFNLKIDVCNFFESLGLLETNGFFSKIIQLPLRMQLVSMQTGYQSRTFSIITQDIRVATYLYHSIKFISQEFSYSPSSFVHQF